VRHEAYRDRAPKREPSPFPAGVPRRALPPLLQPPPLRYTPRPMALFRKKFRLTACATSGG